LTGRQFAAHLRRQCGPRSARSRYITRHTSKDRAAGKRRRGIVRNMLCNAQGIGRAPACRHQRSRRRKPQIGLSRSAGREQGFNVTLERYFDPVRGRGARCFPARDTRVMLNLIRTASTSATRRKAEASEGTSQRRCRDKKNLGDGSNSNRDNGTGISPEDEGKMFDPSTTKPPAREPDWASR